MAIKTPPVAQFQREIETLISAVNACMRSTKTGRDREFDFQHEAFHERCRQAELLASQGLDNRYEWCMHSGDAHRIQESLQLSLAYFRGRPLD